MASHRTITPGSGSIQSDRDRSSYASHRLSWNTGRRVESVDERVMFPLSPYVEILSFVFVDLRPEACVTAWILVDSSTFVSDLRILVYRRDA